MGRRNVRRTPFNTVYIFNNRNINAICEKYRFWLDWYWSGNTGLVRNNSMGLGCISGLSAFIPVFWFYYRTVSICVGFRKEKSESD